MPTQILTTKLFAPNLRSEIVPRPHLIDTLNTQLQRKLTLISAPAGFGKTTIVSEWIAKSDRLFAWLSLDEQDNDSRRFVTYLVCALQTIDSKIGRDILRTLQSSPTVSVESLMTELINDIATTTGHMVLVLDDYHVIDAKPIDDLMTFLLDRLPQQLHIVITTREDPSFSISRLRARRELTEIRASQLRFNLNEAMDFLNSVMGLPLAQEDVIALEKRNEGWIAGLQLAALSMQGRSDIQSFITAFAGDNRYIVDYLVEEVLLRQSDVVRVFLLQTSILDRLSGDLCEAVTTQSDSSAVLYELERSNLFVISLDDKRQWFRYHHLFADVLQVYLKIEFPQLVSTLHQRASDWYMQNGFTTDAVRHAFDAEDFNRVARIMELVWAEMDRTRQFATWLKWAWMLPDEYYRVRPVLNVGYAWALLENGELEVGGDRLDDAEKLLDSPSTEMIIHDEEEFEFLRVSIANARTYLSQAYNDIPATIDYAQQALELLPTDDYLRRGITGSLLGLAWWQQGELETAYEVFSSAMTNFELADNIMFAITGTYILSDMLLTLGKLRKALDTYFQALQLAQNEGESPMQGTADLYLGLSELHYEQGDVDKAKRYLAKSEELSKTAAFPRWKHRWSIFQAHMRQGQGDFADALEMLDEAERQYIRGPVPDMRPISALKAHVWISQGQLVRAQAWADEQELLLDGELSFPHEFEYLVLIRLQIAKYREGDTSTIDGLMTLLSRLLKFAEDSKRHGSMIQILLQQAQVYALLGDMSQALEALKRALILAEPEGFIRTFVDEGKPIQQLLRLMIEQGDVTDFAHKLLSAYDSDAKLSITPTDTNQALIEPLSDRELEILQLVAEGLSNRDISERLYLALSTVKGHNRNIYGKLGVQRRTEAVARARELGLLE